MNPMENDEMMRSKDVTPQRWSERFITAVGLKRKKGAKLPF